MSTIPTACSATSNLQRGHSPASFIAKPQATDHAGGGEQKRFFKLDGHHLTLSTAPMLVGGVESVFSLIWKKLLPEE